MCRPDQYPPYDDGVPPPPTPVLVYADNEQVVVEEHLIPDDKPLPEEEPVPDIHPDRLSARIARARAAFASGTTTSGDPYPYQRRRDDEKLLVLTPDMKSTYLMAAEWGVQQGHIEASEYARIQGAMTGTTDPDTGWHLSCDLAAKVVVTKVCNELLNLRGDA